MACMACALDESRPTGTKGSSSHKSRLPILVVRVSSPHGNGINFHYTMGTEVSKRVEIYKLQMGEGGFLTLH